MKQSKDRPFYMLVYALSLAAFVVALYPFLYVLGVSVSDGDAVMRGRVWLFPVGFSTVGYREVLANNAIWMAYGNTILYTVAGTAFNLIATACAAFPLSRKAFYGRRPFNFLIAFTMYFSGGMIPSYLLITSLGLYNSRWVMILPGLVSTYNLMVCRSAFSAIPDDVMESAAIDGANDIVVFAKIAVKLITPTIAVLTLYYAVAHWNSYFNAMMYLTRQELQPLQILLRRVLIQASDELMDKGSVEVESRSIVSLQIRYVTIIVSTAPILCVYPFVQRYFVKGVMLGAVKG